MSATDIDSTAVEETPTGTSLAVVDAPGGGVIRAETPGEILSKATAIANVLKGLIDAQGLAVNVGGRKPHVEVGAWQACGTMLGALGGQPLHAETVWTRPVPGDDGVTPRRTQYTATVTRYPKGKGKDKPVTVTTYDVDGFDWEARVEVRTASGGVVGIAEAMVSRSEETWSRREDHSLRSMAETRAESRAYRRAIGWIVSLAGYNPTPAEEMGHSTGADTSPPGPVYGPEVSDDQAAQLRRAIAYVLEVGELSHRVNEILAAIENKADGYMPEIAARAVGLVAGAVKTSRTPTPATAPTGGAPSAVADEPTFDPALVGTLPMPVLTGLSPAKKRAALAAAGCICVDPLRPENGNCPLRDHGIPDGKAA